MAGAVSKDSLAKCEQPSMLYDAIRYPSAPYVPPKPRIESADFSKDTLETTQQRLNREMLDKFQNTSSRLSHHSYVAVAQTGKYLFLAIMLPPYLCCYGIPKWMISTLLPQIFLISKVQIMRVGRFFTELSARVADLMKGALEQMLGDSLRASQRHVKAFKDLLKNFFRSQAARLAALKERATNFHKGLHKGIYEAFIRGRDALRQWIERHAFHIIERIVNFIKKIISIILYPIDLCDRIIFMPAIAWFKSKVAIVLSWIRWTQRKMRSRMEPMKKWLSLRCKPIFHFIRRQAEKINALANRGLSSMQCKLAPLYTWIKARVFFAKVQVAHCLRFAGRILAKPLRMAAQQFQKLLQKGVSRIKNLLQRAPNTLKLWIFSPWQTFIKLRAEKAAKRRAQRAKRYHLLGTFFKWLFLGSFHLIKVVFQGFISLSKALSMMCIWWFKQLAAFPARCLNFAIQLFWVCIECAQKGIYGMRVAFAWSIAFYRLGMIQVRAFTSFLDKGSTSR